MSASSFSQFASLWLHFSTVLYKCSLQMDWSMEYHKCGRRLSNSLQNSCYCTNTLWCLAEKEMKKRSYFSLSPIFITEKPWGHHIVSHQPWSEPWIPLRSFKHISWCLCQARWKKRLWQQQSACWNRHYCCKFSFFDMPALFLRLLCSEQASLQYMNGPLKYKVFYHHQNIDILGKSCLKASMQHLNYLHTYIFYTNKNGR